MPYSKLNVAINKEQGRFFLLLPAKKRVFYERKYVYYLERYVFSRYTAN
jgi:hypothetical protein